MTTIRTPEPLATVLLAPFLDEIAATTGTFFCRFFSSTKKAMKMLSSLSYKTFYCITSQMVLPTVFYHIVEFYLFHACGIF